MTMVAKEIRERLALALDTDDLDHALEVALSCKEVFGVVKVGLELYSAYGPEAVRRLAGNGFKVFVDLKLHDIPTTVERASRVLSRSGCAYFTVHTAAGSAALRAAVEGAGHGRGGVDRDAAKVLAVTVLTSQAATEEELVSRIEKAAGAGCDGVVCAAGDVHLLKERHPDMLAVVPGIRPAGSSSDDQVRTATPSEALSQGADLLVIGRAVTGSSDPYGAAMAIVADIAELPTWRDFPG